jgi:hypothetical protein
MFLCPSIELMLVLLAECVRLIFKFNFRIDFSIFASLELFSAITLSTATFLALQYTEFTVTVKIQLEEKINWVKTFRNG